jgi:hypothetical protein
MLSFLLASALIWFAMIRDGLLPAWFAKLHPRFQTPYRPTLIAGALTALVAALDPIKEVAELVNIGTLSACHLLGDHAAAPARTTQLRALVPFTPLAGTACLAVVAPADGGLGALCTGWRSSRHLFSLQPPSQPTGAGTTRRVSGISSLMRRKRASCGERHFSWPSPPAPPLYLIVSSPRSSRAGPNSSNRGATDCPSVFASGRRPAPRRTKVARFFTICQAAAPPRPVAAETSAQIAAFALVDQPIGADRHREAIVGPAGERADHAEKAVGPGGAILKCALRIARIVRRRGRGVFWHPWRRRGTTASPFPASLPLLKRSAATRPLKAIPQPRLSAVDAWRSRAAH